MKGFAKHYHTAPDQLNQEQIQAYLVDLKQRGFAPTTWGDTPTGWTYPIIALHPVLNGEVTFSYRDRKDRGRLKTITLDAHEFIRRFRLHVLLEGLMRIRHFGLLANRSKKETLHRCRELLGLDGVLPNPPEKSTADLMQELTGTDIRRCPAYEKSTLVFVGEIPPSRLDSS